MTAFASTLDLQSSSSTPTNGVTSIARSIARDIAHGLFIVTHNGLAMVGLVTLMLALTFGLRPDLRAATEHKITAWVQEREAQREALLAETEVPAELDAIDRVTATDPKELPKEQARVADWLSKKYRVAPEPIAALVAEAYETGHRVKLDPTLILAVMAIESSFNPFAQSHVGAQGLMQVMTQIHSDKYDSYGGQFAAFDPVSNLRVGVKVLQDCIAQAGSVAGGLKYYVGAANLPTDGGYAEKVIGEYGRLFQVAKGRALPPLPMPVVKPAASATVQVMVKDNGKPNIVPVKLNTTGPATAPVTVHTPATASPTAPATTPATPSPAVKADHPSTPAETTVKAAPVADELAASSVQVASVAKM